MESLKDMENTIGQTLLILKDILSIFFFLIIKYKLYRNGLRNGHGFWKKSVENSD